MVLFFFSLFFCSVVAFLSSFDSALVFLFLVNIANISLNEWRLAKMEREKELAGKETAVFF